jgi:DNA polymerase-1
MKRPLIVLLDSHAIIHRAYHALPELATTSGNPTGAIYGFLMMLAGIIEKFKPDHVVATFDRAEKTFRHEAFDDYKGTRSKTDDALIVQINQIREVCERIGIPVIDSPGFEADDILGTLALQLRDTCDIVIASGDMDTLQLVVGDTVRVFTMRKGIKDTIIYNEQAVYDRFGFGPQSIPDYKAFRGDTSDNIPGIRGIGEKTATELISQHQNLEMVYENIDTIKLTPRIRDLIIQGRDDAEFSLILATIRCDAPVTYVPAETTFAHSFDYSALANVCTEFEFKSMADKFKKVLGSNSSVLASASASVPTKSAELDSRSATLHSRLKQASISPESDAEAEETAVSLKSDHDKELDKEKVEIPFDQLRRLQIMRWLLDSRNMRESVEGIYENLNVENADDAESILMKKIESDGLMNIWQNLEEPLIPIMAEMESHGILVDKEVLQTIGITLKKDLQQLESDIYTYTGEININSPKQLGDALYDTLGLKPKRIKKTAGGARSTKEEELHKMADQHPVIGLILEYREKQKLNSTYIIPLIELVDTDSRLHPILWQDGTTTGRFSSERPNIQNLPVRTELGKSIRNAIVAPRGYSLVKMDYSQIELRVTALLSGDSFMQQVFIDGRDIHTEVAARVFAVDPVQVDSEMRRKAKVINFGIIYGMGVTALQKNLQSTRAEAEVFHTTYFEQFPTIAEYFEKTKQRAAELGYTTTLWGRRRYFPEIRSKLPFLRASAERMAMNAPIQGTATADIIKFGMLDAAKVLERFPGNHMIAQIHDELLFEIRNEDADTLIPMLKQSLESVMQSHAQAFDTVPLLVSVERGDNWGETYPVIV